MVTGKSRAPTSFLLFFFASFSAFLQAADFTEPLPIPRLLEGTRAADGTLRFELTAAAGSTRFFSDTETPTMGYNGSILGPTISVSRGDRVAFTIMNELSEPTTLHWHGLRVPAEMDGGPMQVIAAGSTWNPRFTIGQEAATLWYHPHLMGKTAEHVYLGLAGLFIIEDDNSRSLDIPKRYGADDIPLILQERRFSGQTFTYSPAMPDVMHGYTGNEIIVNGAVRPVLDVPASLVRFRLLNGSNSSIHRIRFSDGRTFSMIASDGGFLEEPTAMDNVILSPGERAEILVDFSGSSDGRDIHLSVETYQGAVYEVLRIRARGDSRPMRIPERLNTIKQYGMSEWSRTFSLQSMGMGGGLTINGKRMDMSRIDERVPLNRTETWVIENPAMGMMALPHSFHVHDVQFLIVDIDGKAPPRSASGWKDTVLVWPGSKVRIALRFEDYTGIYFYHCHLLEHEDEGMMGKFEVY